MESTLGSTGQAQAGAGVNDIKTAAASEVKNLIADVEELMARISDLKDADIVRVRVYLADRRDVVAVSSLLRETFADPRPTNTTIICGFADPAIKVELEVTALRRR